MNKKKLLILSDWYLPAVNAGGPVRSVSAIANQLSSNFDISILTSDRDFGAESPFPDIDCDIWIKKDGYRVKYISPLKIKTTISEELKNDYFKIYFNSLFSVPFTLNPMRLLSKKDRRGKMVLATRGMLGKGALELKSTKKKFFLFVVKLFGFFKGITWHASTDLEKKEIQDVFGMPAKVVSIENLAACVSQSFSSLEKQKNELKLVFVSRISPKKNLKFLLEIIDQLKFKISLDIYGPKEDVEYWEECEGLMSDSSHTITYKGILNPDELSIEISKYHLFVLPTLNENFGHIILETLNSSVPVLLSDQTPWLNLETQKAGKELPLDKPDLWLKWLRKFYEIENQEYQEWRKGAWKVAQKKLVQKELVIEYIKMFS